MHRPNRQYGADVNLFNVATLIIKQRPGMSGFEHFSAQLKLKSLKTEFLLKVRHPSGVHDQFVFLFSLVMSVDSCGFIDVGCPL
jgi:hypothetical protein